MYKIKIFGKVQGVFCRQNIYNEAIEKKLIGTVQNVGDYVEVIVNDKEKMIQIINSLPKHIEIKNIITEKIQNSNNYTEFKII